MIEGASNRVPAAPHWDIFRQAERDHPNLIAALADEIRKSAAGLTEVNSTTAGPRSSRSGRGAMSGAACSAATPRSSSAWSFG